MDSEIFQVGIEVEETRVTVVTVRLRAKSLEAAQKKAKAEIDKRTDGFKGRDLVDDYMRDWDHCYYSCIGVAPEEYPEGEYSANLDLTAEEYVEEPEEPHPNQLDLISANQSCRYCGRTLSSDQLRYFATTGWVCRDMVVCQRMREP